MKMAGAEGSLMWGYHVAATVRDWTVASDGAQRSLSAAIVRLDDFRLSQRPLMFVAPHRGGAWSWPVLELQAGDATLTARLGPRK